MKTIFPQRKGNPNIKSGDHEGPARRAPSWGLGEMLEAHLTNLDSMVRGFGAARGPSNRSPARNG